MNYMVYKTPHFGGPGPKGRVGLAWRDVMAGKSIRPDQDADNGRVLGNARCLKITEKVSFNIASEASYVYILSGPKLIKTAKNGPIWRDFENLKLAVKQCYQTGQF